MTVSVHACSSCHQPLGEFEAYIPGVGESCMRCWMEYARQEKREKPRLPSIRKMMV